MAKPMSNTMHLRIELDAKKAQQGVEALNASMLSAVKNLQELKGKGYADDSPEVKAVMNQIVGLKAIINQTLQSFRDIDAAIKNTAEVSRREIASLIKQNEKRADTLFPSDKDFKKDLAVMRERHEVLQRVYEQRKVSQRDFASALKNLANQTDDQLKVLIQQSEHAAKSLQRGSVEMRNAYSAYKQFTDEQARRRGEQTYSSMIRAAGTQPDADQLRALKKEADTLMKTPLLNDESKNKLAVVIDGINEAIKRANPAPLRELDKVLKEIGSTTDLKGMEMLRLQLGGIIKAAADPKATDVMKTQIEKITKGIADPDTVNKLKEKITKLYSSISDPDVKAKAEEAVKGIFSSFTNPQALDDFRFQLEQAFSKLGDPIDVNKLMGNLESTFRHLTSNSEIQKARDYMNNMFIYQDSPKKVETYKKGLEDIFNTLARNFPALKGEVEQAKGYIDQFYNAISDKSKADKITSNMHDLMMAIVDPEVRIQLEQMQKLLHDGSIVDPAKVTESKGLMKDLMAALADPARRGDLPTIIDQLNGTLLSQEKISAATEQFRKLGEQIKSATPRDLDAVMGDFMGGKRGKFSLEEMLKMRDEIQKRITDFGSVMPDAELEKSNAALKNMEQNILNISRNIADGSVKASYEDMKTALSVIEGKWKTLDPNVRKNQELIAALGTEYHKLKEAVDSWGKPMMTAEQANEVLAQSLELVRSGVEADATAVRYYIEQIEIAKNAQGLLISDVNNLSDAQKALKDNISSSAAAFMSETDAIEAIAKAEKLLENIDKAHVGETNDAIDALNRLKNARNTSNETAARADHLIKKLGQSQKDAAKWARELGNEEEFVNKTLKNLHTAPVKDLEKAMLILKQRMKDSETGLKDYIKSSIELKKVQNQVKAINSEFGAQEDFITKASTKLMSYLGIFGGFYLIKQKVTEAFQANIKFDDSLTNIRKTTGLTAEAVDMLANNIKRIDTRTSLDEITNLAYAAGRLGVKGVSDVMAFVTAANQINIALGEQLNGAESVEQLMKVTELMGQNQELGLEQALLKTGSAINHLTMNTQATAQPMVDFMRRTAGMATQAGITTSELTGLAGAVNALGQPVEMSATSISKMLVQMEKNSVGVAKALQMSAQETADFMNNLRTGHAMDALLTVLEKTREMGGLSPLSHIVKDLGSEGQRVIQTISTLASNYDKVREMVEMSNGAFEEGVSVTNEYNIKNQNTAALLERIKNAFSKMTVSPEIIEYIHDFLDELQELPKAVAQFMSAFQPVIWFLGELGKSLINVTSLWSGFAWAIISRSVVSFISKFVLSILEIKKGFQLATQGAKGFFTFLKTASFGNIFTLIITAIGWIASAWATASVAAKKFHDDLAEGLERVKDQVKSETAAIETLLTKLERAQDGTLARQQVIDEINKTYGEYLGNLLEESMSYEEIARAMEAVNAQIELRALLEGKQKAIQQVKDDNARSFGKSQRNLINTIANSIAGDPEAARSTAAKIVARFLSKDENGNYVADKYMERKINKEGNIEYGRTLLNDFKEMFNGVQLKEDYDSYNRRGSIFGALYDVMQEQAKIDNSIAEVVQSYDTDLKNASLRAGTFYAGKASDAWKVISQNITQGGTVTDLTQLTRDKEVVWADKRDQMTKEERNAEIKRVKQYVDPASLAVESLKGSDNRNQSTKRSDWTEEYRRAYDDLSLARQYLNIFELGTLTPNDDTKDKDKAQKTAKQEYENLINKIEEFYAWQADERRMQREKGDLTTVELERKLKENNRDRLLTLAIARGAIAGDLTDAEWRKRLEEIVNIAGKNGEEALQRVKNVKDLPSIGTAINKEDKEDGNSTVNQIRRNRAQNMVEYQKEANEIAKSINKAWMEQNPIGKITDQFFDDLQKLDLIFSKKNPIEPIKDKIMEMYLEIGRNTSKYFIENKEDFDRFKEYVQQQPLFDSKQVKNDDDYKRLYYKAYEYAEQYDEAVTRLVTRQQNTWKKMLSRMQSEFDKAIENLNLEELKKAEQFLENFGLSKRVGLKEELKLRQQILRTHYEEWQKMQDMAKAQLDAAKASGDKDEIATAQAQVDALKNAPKEVIEAYKAVTEAQLSVKMTNHAWLSSIEKQFEEFGKNIFKLRSWYDNKGDLFTNMFGTKEERKQAFAQLMDNLKQQIRDEAVERVRAIISMKIQERLAKHKVDVEELSEEDKKRKEKEDKEKESAKRQEQTWAESYANRLKTETDFYGASIDMYQEYQKEHHRITEELNKDLEETNRKMQMLAQSDDDSWLMASNDNSFLADAKRRMNNSTGEYHTPDSTYKEIWKPTPNVRTEESDSAKAGHSVVNEKKGIVMHHTGSFNAKGDLNTLTNANTDNPRSAHFLIDTDGTRYVLADPDKVTFHAGKSHWGGYDKPQFRPENNGGVDRRNANDYMLGVEFVGDTAKKDLTEDQIKSVIEALAPIIKENNIPLENIVSHGDVAKGRKADVTAESLERLKAAFLKEVYTPESGLPLTAAEAEALWAKQGVVKTESRLDPKYQNVSGEPQKYPTSSGPKEKGLIFDSGNGGKSSDAFVPYGSEMVVQSIEALRTQLQINNEELIAAIQEAMGVEPEDKKENKEKSSSGESSEAEISEEDETKDSYSKDKPKLNWQNPDEIKENLEQNTLYYKALEDQEAESYDKMRDMQKDYAKDSEEAEKNKNSKIQKEDKKGADKILKNKKDEGKKEQTIQEQATRGLIDIVKFGAKEKLGIEDVFGQQVLSTMAELATKEIVLNHAKTETEIEEKKKKTMFDVMAGIASGSSEAVAELGPWGIPLIAVISAALSALLSAAMNALGGGAKPTTPTKTKLVTGMLTYDSGNVQSFPVMGDDGRVYNINNVQDSLPTGMVTKPTLTTVNGQPALVGERGPEMVIGRETTRAMMMYAPDLLQQISLFDRHRSNGKIKTYDEGNASAFASAMQSGQPTDRAMTNDELREMMLGMQMALAQSNEVNARLAAQLQRGIKASINKYGPEGLVEEVASGFVESRQLRNNKNITRLFG